MTKTKSKSLKSVKGFEQIEKQITVLNYGVRSLALASDVSVGSVINVRKGAPGTSVYSLINVLNTLGLEIVIKRTDEEPQSFEPRSKGRKPSRVEAYNENK